VIKIPTKHFAKSKGGGVLTP